jgi:hypothetical protein
MWYHLFWVIALTCLLVRHTSSSPAPCTPETAATCLVDDYVGSNVIFEDNSVRIWNFTLAKGAMTSMHRHDCQVRIQRFLPSSGSFRVIFTILLFFCLHLLLVLLRGCDINRAGSVPRGRHT